MSARVLPYYGVNVLSNTPPIARRAAVFAVAVTAFVLLLAPIQGPVDTAVGAALLAPVGWATLSQLASGIAETMRCPQRVYRLRDRRGWVLYVGRTNDYDERFAAHLDDDNDPARAWKQHIDDTNSAPFRACFSPLGVWASERFRIRQASTLGAWRLAPAVRNDVLNRPYRGPLALWAVALWAAEEACFGTSVQPGELDHVDPPPPRWTTPDEDDDIIDAEVVEADYERDVPPPYWGDGTSPHASLPHYVREVPMLGAPAAGRGDGGDRATQRRCKCGRPKTHKYGCVECNRAYERAKAARRRARSA